MSLADDLLGLAREMAESTNPDRQQARLRRAASTAYYSLFHLLVEEAAARFVDDPKIRTLVGRGFSHTDLAKAATTFQSGAGALPDHMTAVFPDSLPDEIVEISKTIVTLQRSRHAADYNLLVEFDRAKVIGFVSKAERAFADFRTLLADPAAKTALDLFLASLLLIDRWKK
jgi:uncharacterized protein (UPF0332 family)